MLEAIVPILCAILNRFRGNDIISKGLWFAIMTALPLVLRHSIYFCVLWLIFLLGYAVLPWQAMFSAATGRPPRNDKGYMQQLSDLALYLTKLLPPVENKVMWYRFGMVYGALRAVFMWIGVAGLYAYTGSLNALYGLLFVFMGVIYYFCGVYARKKEIPEKVAIEFAELVLGWCIGAYLVVL